MKFQRRHAKARQKSESEGDAILAKKSFHYLKLVHKEIKRAKQFEIRKIVRRIKQATTEGKGQAAAMAAKLEAQLAAARAADVDVLTSRAAQAHGLQQQQQQQQQQQRDSANVSNAWESPVATSGAADEPQAALIESAPAEAVDEAREAVYSRILAAKCVKTQAAAAQQELEQLAKKLVGSAAKAAAAAPTAAAAEDEEGQQRKHQEELEGADGESVRKDDGQEKQQVKVSKALDAMAEEGVAKLLSGRKGQQANDGDGDTGERLEGSSAGEDHVKGEGGGELEGEGSELMMDSDGERNGRGLASGSDGEVDSFDSEAYKAAMSDGQEAEISDSEGGVVAAVGGSSRVQAAEKLQQRPGQGRGQRQEHQEGEQEGRGQKKPKKTAVPKKAKNRLGQRARRKLAAQMFGRSARHLQEQQQAAEHGAGDGQHGQQQQPQQKPKQKPKQQHPTQHTGGKGGESDDGAALHPSWAAKRQQKLQISISAAVPAAAKKITFDEDGDSAAHTRRPKAAASPGTTAAAGGKPTHRGGVARSGGQRPQHAKEQGDRAVRPLHPSWEAKKKQAAMQKSMLKPAGTKITFED